jgi:hypothetical protein
MEKATLCYLKQFCLELEGKDIAKYVASLIFVGFVFWVLQRK